VPPVSASSPELDEQLIPVDNNNANHMH